MEKAGVIWRRLEPFDDDDGEDDLVGVDCEIVTFGFYLYCRGHYSIPRQFLRPATMKDLIQRHSEISNLAFQSAFARRGEETDPTELNSYLLEQYYIADEVHRREAAARAPAERRRVFLCHSSEDKPFVRQVRNDLANAGHSVWIDEFEIQVGESITAKIAEATESADALVLFLSDASSKSEWVKREWGSTLARMLSGQTTRILPALIEDCPRPSLLADIKYADFRESYHSGLEELLAGLASLPNAKSE